MEKLTDVEGKPVFINANRVTHITINIETDTPEIHFVGGTSTTVVDADRLILNDSGTVVQIAASDMKTYIGSSEITTAGTTFSNYNSIGSNISTTTESAKNFFLVGPITVSSSYTWTVDGDGSLAIL